MRLLLPFRCSLAPPHAHAQSPPRSRRRARPRSRPARRRRAGLRVQGRRRRQARLGVPRADRDAAARWQDHRPPLRRAELGAHGRQRGASPRSAGNAPGAGAKDIPWLKLEVIASRGSGTLSGVTTVQRINTRRRPPRRRLREGRHVSQRAVRGRLRVPEEIGGYEPQFHLVGGRRVKPAWVSPHDHEAMAAEQRDIARSAMRAERRCASAPMRRASALRHRISALATPRRRQSGRDREAGRCRAHHLRREQNTLPISRPSCFDDKAGFGSAAARRNRRRFPSARSRADRSRGRGTRRA